jgi:hypothetical protein
MSLLGDSDMTKRLSVRSVAGSGLFVTAATLFCGVVPAAPAAAAAREPVLHRPSHGEHELGVTVGIRRAWPRPGPDGPQMGQSCNDPLKLAYDPSGGALVCTSDGTWASSIMPTAVRSLGAPCPPSESGGQLIAKTPDDHMITCPTGGWVLYHP